MIESKKGDKEVWIKNGRVYDPINTINNQIKDIWIKNGKIVSKDQVDPSRAEIIDASGKIVMPGGVDIHSHIAGGKVNSGRKMRPDDSRRNVRKRSSITRSGTGLSVPSTFKTAYDYVEMGYTTVMEGASPPLMARHTHEEFDNIPIIDKGGYILMGNNHFIMEAIRNKEYSKARDYVAWLLNATKGFGIKIVNPGGVENYKYNKNVTDLDDKVIGFDITPRQILETFARINHDLGLPHVPHIHGLNLGLNGNAAMTIKTFEALEGRQGHFTHLQFMSYGSEMGKPVRSGAEAVAEQVNAHPNITIDVGQIIFCDTTTMTADGPVQHRLHVMTGNKWFNDDVEAETGGGVTPCIYKKSNPFNAVQWIVGLELFLLIKDPWRVFLTTDHPNAGPFTSYPEIIRLLMDKDVRMEMFEGLNKTAKKGALLPNLDREYSLYEIAILTRAGTAKRLGLDAKGHLGPGADADITIYNDLDDKEAMFSSPAYVFKGGDLVARNGKIVNVKKGSTLYVSPGFNSEIEREIQTHVEKNYTIAFSHYSVTKDEVSHGKVIPCKIS
jgi:formylmethanofuran dehydrogenase subunit A